MKTDKTWIQLACDMATPVALVIALVVYIAGGSISGTNTAVALAEFKTEFKTGMKEMSVRLEGLPTLVERTTQNEARIKEAQTYIGLLDTRQSVTERQAAAFVVEFANLKASLTPRR